jgi:hypothetical protein
VAATIDAHLLRDTDHGGDADQPTTIAGQLAEFVAASPDRSPAAAKPQRGRSPRGVVTPRLRASTSGWAAFQWPRGRADADPALAAVYDGDFTELWHTGEIRSTGVQDETSATAGTASAWCAFAPGEGPTIDSGSPG